MTDVDLAVLHTVGPERAADIDAELADRIPEATVRVAGTPAESRDLLARTRAALVGRLPEDLLDAAADLDWIQTVSAGVDFLPLDRLRESGVVLTNASGVHAEPIAEQVLGYLLVFERGIHRGFENKQRGVWERYEGGELRGKTLGVVGVGAIGSRVAELGSALGMTVLGTKRDPTEPPAAADAVDELYGPDGLWDLLDGSDYLVVACPLTDETRGLLGREELLALGSGAVLVNVARGEVVDQDALTVALQHGWLRGAALDVFEEEPLPADSVLWDLSNVVVTPHMAGSTPEKVQRLAGVVAENYRAFAGDGEYATRVL